MYELAKKAREGMKAKARRLASETVGKVDSSTWSPAPLLRADIKTGARPIMKPSKKGIGESNAARDTKAAIGNPTRGAFKQGGAVKKDGGILDKKAVGAVEVLPKRGAAQNYKKGGRIKKLSGGKLMDYVKGASDSMHNLAYEDPEGDAIHNEGMVGHKLENRNWGIKKAVDKLKGKYGASGKKAGGRIKREDGGKLPSPYEAMESEARRKTIKVDRPADRKLPSAKEAAESAARVGDVPEGRKHGGKAKKIAKKKGGGVGLTVIIADKGSRGAAPQGMAAPIAPRAVPVPPAAPPMPAAPPPAAMQPPPMGRRAGGRITKVAKSYKDMEAGSGSGEGRLQKTDIAKKRKGAPTS
jgi:hypothetical protein